MSSRRTARVATGRSNAQAATARGPGTARSAGASARPPMGYSERSNSLRSATSLSSSARSSFASSAFDTGRSSIAQVSSGVPSSRISFRQPSTVRSYGLDSQSSTQRDLKMRGHDLHSRVRRKIDETSKIAKVFLKFDADKSGAIDHDEFKTGLDNLGFECNDREVKRLLKVVDPQDRGQINYVDFVRAMVDTEDSHKVDRRTDMLQYAERIKAKLAGGGASAAAKHDDFGFGSGMLISEDANALSYGQVNTGDENRHQRDVGDRAAPGDVKAFSYEHGAMEPPKHVHTFTDEGLSYFEKALRTPRFAKMNPKFAALRVSSPGMGGQFNKSIYGDQDRVDMSDPFCRNTRVDPLTARSTQSFRDEAAFTGGVKPVNSRSELFAKRRGENFRELAQLKQAVTFGADVNLRRVYHFVKDKPGACNRRMGDCKFDPKTGVDLQAYEKAAMAKHAHKVTEQARKRRLEAMVGRGN